MINDSQSKSLAKSTIIVNVLSVLNIIFNFICQVILAYYFGTGTERDAYFAAVTIPTYIAVVFTGSIGMIFLPQIMKCKQIERRAFFSSLINLLLIILCLIVLFCFFFSEEILTYTISGFSNEQRAFTNQILMLLLPTMIFQVINNSLFAHYHSIEQFIKPALTPILVATSTIIFTTIFAEDFGIKSTAIGVLTGNFIASLMLFIPIYRAKSFSFKIDLKILDKSGLFRIFLPLFLSGFLFRSTSVLERMFASGLEEGSISYLGYASQIIVILVTIIASGIGTTIFPKLSAAWHKKDFNEFEKYYLSSLRFIFTIVCPVICLVSVFNKDVVSILFEYGSFGTESSLYVGKLILVLMGSLFFQCLGNITAKVFYLSGRTSLFSFIGIIEIMSYIILAWGLIDSYGVYGLALAVSVSSGINIMISIIILNRYVLVIKYSKIFTNVVKIFFSNVLFISCLILLYQNMVEFMSTLMNIIVSGMVSVLLLILTYWLFKVPELEILIKLVNKKINLYDDKNRNLNES